MDEDKSQKQPHSGQQREEITHSTLQNINALPAPKSLSILEAVIEEDENSVHKGQSAKNQDGRVFADTEVINNDAIPNGVLFFTSNSAQVLDGIKVKSLKRSELQKEGTGHKLVSRANSAKPQISRLENIAHLGQNSGSGRELEGIHQDDSHADTAILGVDTVNEKEWDTDLEMEDQQVTYDHTGKTAYVEACRKFDVVPAAYFLRHMNDNELSMKHHGLTGDEMRAIAASLAANTTINRLDLSDNWLHYDGGLAICEALKENCFITDLNLSDNHLSLCAEQLCQIIKHNNTLCRVNLSGNCFEDESATYLADLIMHTTKLEFLNLSHNSLAEKAGLLLGSAISENLCLKELDLSWNHLRRKGAMAVAYGIKNNVYMKIINLAWNGFGLEGSAALMDALKANSVLQEMDITNNRINTEGAVLIGKGLTANETLTVFKIGKNPIQSSGCWGIAAAILRNQNCNLKYLEFKDIPVNRDFMDIWKQVEEQFPHLEISHGGIEESLKASCDVHPRDKIITYMSKHNISLVDFFSHLNKDETMTLTSEAFKQGIELLNQTTSISLTDTDVNMLLEELDITGNGEIKYRELELENLKLWQKEHRIRMRITQRPMTS